MSKHDAYMLGLVIVIWGIGVLIILVLPLPYMVGPALSLCWGYFAGGVLWPMLCEDL